MYGSDAGNRGREGSPARRKMTAPRLQKRKGKTPITMVTAYDFTMARLLDEGGVDALLVGDSLGMVVQGESTTIPVTIDDICYHTRAVARGAQFAHVVADMPFMSFQVSPIEALKNAGRLMKEGRAESVKLEGGQAVAEHILRITAAGIPVMGHVGLTPQSVHALGGFKVQGKHADAEARLIEDAIALEQAGAYAIVVEAVPPDVAERLSAAVSVPTIGIGAGAGCDGQVLVCYDMLGMTSGRTPRFVKEFGRAGDEIRRATAQFIDEVQTRSFPDEAHSYKPRRTATGKLAAV